MHSGRGLTALTQPSSATHASDPGFRFSDKSPKGACGVLGLPQRPSSRYGICGPLLVTWSSRPRPPATPPLCLEPSQEEDTVPTYGHMASPSGFPKTYLAGPRGDVTGH